MADFDNYSDLSVILKRFFLKIEDHSKVIKLIKMFEPVDDVKLKIGREGIVLLDIEDIKEIATELELSYSDIMYPYNLIDKEDPKQVIQCIHTFFLEVASQCETKKHRKVSFKVLTDKIAKELRISNVFWNFYFLKNIISRCKSNRAILSQYLRPIYERTKALEGEEPFDNEEGEIKEESKTKLYFPYTIRKRDLESENRKFLAPTDQNVKAFLHEMCIRRNWPQPRYQTVEVPRPHARAEKRYKCSIYIHDTLIANVSSEESQRCRRKKTAEILCAYRAYDRIIID